MVNRDLVNYREEYGIKELKKENMLENPVEQFRLWFQKAELAGVKEPNTMTLATVNQQGQPTIRVVLMKEISSQGIVFYTNYKSRKGREIDSCHQVALNFFWQDLERQVRFDGVVSKVSSEESDHYFDTRPRGSQLGAWISEQSKVIPSRKFLEEQLSDSKLRFKDQKIPRPPHWGGYHFIPTEVEFWQGGANRLHDRVQYLINKEHHWSLKRLAP